MKVLQINSVCGIRSTGRITTDIADELAENGDDCKIAFGRCNVPNCYRKYSLRIGSSIGVVLHVIYSRLFDAMGFGSKHATKALIKQIKQYDPDIIHLHNIHGYFININVLFSYLRECGKPVIWTMHDCWPITGHCTHFIVESCNKWETACKDCIFRQAYPKRLFTGRTSHNYNRKKQLFLSVPSMTVVTPCRWLADIMKRSFLKVCPTEVIYNGIDLSVFRPTPADIRKRFGIENRFVILGVSNTWTERKGLSDFYKLASLLDDTYKIVLIGLDDKQMKEKPDCILGISRTNSIQELAEWYSAADIFVNPSQEETFCLVNLEALACGTPVITYDVGGCAEAIDDNVGKCVHSQDIAGLTEAIKQQRRQSLYKSADCVSAARKYDKRNMAKKYRSLYMRIISMRCNAKNDKYNNAAREKPE